MLVDVKKIPELNTLTMGSDGLTIGAAVPLYKIYEDKRIATAYPDLVDAIMNIGGVAIQSRATVGGNLCNAAPSGDSIPSLIVHKATCRVAGSGGQHDVPLEEFFVEPGRTVLNRGELLVSVQVPLPEERMGASYMKFIPRSDMDIAVVGVGASLVLNEGFSRIETARLALGAVASTPILVRKIGDVLSGRKPDEESWSEAASIAQAASRPISDVRGSAELRRHLVGVFARRTLRNALARAKGGAI